MLAALFWAAAPTRTAEVKPFWLEIGAEVGVLFSWDEQEFLQRYRALTHAQEFPPSFPPGELVALSLRIPLDSLWRLRLSIGTQRLRLDHTYRQTVEEEFRRGERLVRTVLQLSALPIWIGAEWQPIRTQFRSYLHAAAGIVPVRLSWQEDITSSVPEDTRRGGLYRDQWRLRPGVRLLAGTALGFDAAARGSLLQALQLEAAVCFIPLREPFLLPVAAQLAPPFPFSPAEALAVGNTQLTLTLSLVIQLPLLLPHPPSQSSRMP